MNILVSYDIQHDNLRIKLAKKLTALGLIRVQYSVFMGNVPERIKNQLSQFLLRTTSEKNWGGEDALLMIPLHEYSKERMQTWGKMPADWDLTNDPPHTLIL